MSDYSTKRTIIGHLEREADLYDSIARIVEERGIRIGKVTAIGAVQRSRIAYYHQTLMRYEEIDIPEPMEILSLNGNISVKEGKPFLHAHIVLGDEQGNVHGGHLLPGGTPVFACELAIEEYDGPILERFPEKSTGLTLWPKERIL